MAVVAKRGQETKYITSRGLNMHGPWKIKEVYRAACSSRSAALQPLNLAGPFYSSFLRPCVCVCVCVVDVCIRKFGSSSPSWLDVQSSSFSIQQCDGYPSNIIPIPFHPAVMGNRHLLGGQILLTMSHPSAERHGQASCAFLAWLQEVHYYNISGHVY